MRRILTRVFTLALIGGLAAGGFYLKQKIGAPKVAGTTVVSTTFGDWLVTCTEKQDGLPCEMSQQLVDGKSGQALTRFSITWSPDAQKHALQIVVPLGVWLEPGAAMGVGELKIEGIQFSRCMPQGCVIEALLEDPMLSALKDGKKGQLVIFDRARQQANLPFSLLGFGDADARLIKDTKRMTAEPFSMTATVDSVSSWFKNREADDVSGDVIEMKSGGTGDAQ